MAWAPGTHGSLDRRIALAHAAEIAFAQVCQIAYYGAIALDGLTIYTDDKAAILSAMQRSSQKAAALDLVPAQKPKRIEQNRQRKRRFHYLKRLREAWPSLARLTGVRRDRDASHATRNAQERPGQDFDHGR
jgi:hypothetical protein